jgi:hypothetical protein
MGHSGFNSCKRKSILRRTMKECGIILNVNSFNNSSSQFNKRNVTEAGQVRILEERALNTPETFRAVSCSGFRGYVAGSV